MLESLYYTEDVLALLAALGDIADADPENVFMWGHSMDGEVTLRTLLATDVPSSASPPSRDIKQPAARQLPPRDAWRRPEFLRSRSDRSVPRDRVPERRTPLPS